ncbi:serine/threonine-protein kinase [Glutamicibacter sp.]|uniref:serine/threonine-protein kinase n=2 Tax=Glutamicibacter sp. TaxID=1931995 RepID=UPI002FCA8AAD
MNDRSLIQSRRTHLWISSLQFTILGYNGVMDDSTNVLAWPTSPGHVTVRPLSSKSPCKVWLIRRESDQLYLTLKLSLTMENITSLRQEQVTQSRKYVVDFYGTLSTQLGEGLVMEYCPGGSVADLVASRSAFGLGECVTALAPIAQTLSVMHAQGQRHGDLSPANILLTAKGMPKIIDFQESASARQALTGSGTPGFMAPEMQAGVRESQVGEQDVFSLGACLWFLLSGRIPEEELMRPPASVMFPGIPSIIHELLIDSLNPDPQARPTADQFARTLFASCPAEPISWEGHVAPEATHLMETIHPSAEQNAAHKRFKRQADTASRQRSPSRDDSWHSHRLRRTPGAVKLAGAAALGSLVIIGSLVGVNHFRAAVATETTAATAVPSAEQSCRIEDGAHVPACALNRDTVISAFLALSRERDEAMGQLAGEKLKGLYTSGAEQLQRDLETIDQLRKMGLEFAGLRTRLTDVTVSARGQGDSVILAATSTQEEYRYVDARGATVHAVQAAQPQRIEVELVLEDERWKIGKVLRR